MFRFITTLFITVILTQTQKCQKLNEMLDFAILVPQDEMDGGCTKAAIQMAADDVNKIDDFIYREKLNTSYKLRLRYTSVDQSGANAIDAMYNMYHNKDSQIIYSTIGPPYKDQSELCTEYSTANANVHVSYTEANEPMEEYYVFWYPTPPSIISSFQAAKAMMEYHDWTKMAIIYDYSDGRYRKNSDNLRAIMQTPNNKNGSKPIKILSDQGIWSEPPNYKVSKELNIIQNEGARLIFSLVSVSGARKVFCEAFKRKMYAPKVIWVLFEILPKDWASDKHNVGFNKQTGQISREIDCTEAELLQASHDYISITKHGLRRDGVQIISNMTAQTFRSRLQQRVKTGVTCHENVAYAYDALWVLALAHKEYAASKQTINYQDYHYQFFPVALQLRDFVRALDFEGLTGRLSYEIQLHGIWNRIGQAAVWSNKRNGESIYVGKHDYRKDKLTLVKNSANLLFQNGDIPRDEARYVTINSEVPKPLFITLWTIAVLGIMLAFSFLTIMCFYSSNGMTSFPSPAIYSVTVVGSILCFFSVIIYGIDTRFITKENTPQVCWGFLITLSLGFTLMFGSLFAKAWQLYKLYLTPEVKVENNQLHMREVSEWSLFIIIGLLVLIDVIIFIAWHQVSNFEYEIRNVTKEENLFKDTIHIEQIVGCKCKYRTEFTIGLYCYKGCLLIFGIFIAWQTRYAKIKIQNESRQIAMAIYNVVAVSLIGVICVSVLVNTTVVQALYVIIAVCICVSTIVTLLLVFVPKIRKTWLSDRLQLSTSSNASSNSGDSNSNGEPVRKMTIGYMRKSIEKKPTKTEPSFTIRTFSTQISTDSSPKKGEISPTGSTANTSLDDSTVTSISAPPAYLSHSTFLTQTSMTSLENNEVPRNVDQNGRLSCGIYVGKIHEERPSDDDIVVGTSDMNETV